MTTPEFGRVYARRRDGKAVAMRVLAWLVLVAEYGVTWPEVPVARTSLTE